jgi:hypothetical protein
MQRRLIAGTLGIVIWLSPSTALACSPPFEDPTIAALGPGQVVVVGTIGEQVDGGRLFHVERWFNGGVPAPRIVIAFKEGEPVGDCSYPVSTGQRLIVAPDMVDGRLAADLVTLQADPSSDQGRRYVAEAVALFGPGVTPDVGPDTVSALEPWQIAIGLGAVVLALIASVTVVARRRTD